MKTATLIKDRLEGFRGYASLYRLSEPILQEKYDYESDQEREFKHNYVVVSTATVPFGLTPDSSNQETYIFGADKNGKVTNWTELTGSRRGQFSHVDVLEGIGYTVVLGD